MQYETITRENVKLLVDQFYGRVHDDAILGSVFTRALGTDWTDHLEKLTEFWSTIVLGTRSFHGNVYGKHMALEGITPKHFQRWLSLFEETITTLFDANAAAQFRTMAHRVASSLQIGFFGEVKVHPACAG